MHDDDKDDDNRFHSQLCCDICLYFYCHLRPPPYLFHSFTHIDNNLSSGYYIPDCYFDTNTTKFSQSVVQQAHLFISDPFSIQPLSQ
jgi:hypothetical protein